MARGCYETSFLLFANARGAGTLLTAKHPAAGTHRAQKCPGFARGDACGWILTRTSCYVMLCYVMLCYVMLCYVMLCYVMLCYVMLCYVMLCYVMLCYVMLCYVMLCYVMLCYVMLCYVMLWSRVE